MANPGLSDEEKREAIEAYQREGTANAAARALGLHPETYRNRLNKALADPAIEAAKVAVNTNMTPSLVWAKTKDEEGNGYSVLLRPAEIQDDMLSRVRAAFEGMKPAEPAKAPEATLSDLVTTYLIADAHIGMMAWGEETGEDYSTKKAAQRVKDWVAKCVAASPAAETAIILDIGDYTHANDGTNQTPASRHVLDVDTRHFRTMDLAIEALGTAVDCALTKHLRVIVRVLPGNHNRDAYLVVMFALAERYRNEPRVTVEKDPSEFFLFEFGNVMIAAHHGDKAKAPQLVNFVADEFAEAWGRTKHRFLFTGHLHHHKSQDIGGMKWEQLRAVTARDSYATSHAYCARSQLQAVTFDRNHGEAQRVYVGA